MPKGKNADKRKRQKQLARRRRLDKERSRHASAQRSHGRNSVLDQVNAAYDLIGEGDLAAADELLGELAGRPGAHADVFRAQMCLYQQLQDHNSCSAAARRLLELTPRDPEARLVHAQESAICGRLAIGVTDYRRFLRQWPDHAFAQKARVALELAKPECDKKLKSFGFERLDLLVTFEKGQVRMQQNDFEQAAAKFSQVLERSPQCLPARNNLAVAWFHAGQLEKALHEAEATCRIAPDNRFAEATLGKIQFLSGREEQAHAITDRLMVDPPVEQDPLAATVELLSFLGRDEDIVLLSETAKRHGIPDPRCQSMVLHHLAVAQYRLGDERAARSSWKKCLKAMPSHSESQENLADLDSRGGHAPWGEPLLKWLPPAVCKALAQKLIESDDQPVDLVDQFPTLTSVVPALLDRGDPEGRQLAFTLAAADGSHFMLDALQRFAFGTRGPESMRFEALTILNEQGRIGKGPHRIYRRGQWTDIELFTAEITWEATAESTPELVALAEKGGQALREGAYAAAEEAFNEILERDPDNCSAAYNRCAVWMGRDGKAGRRRAETVIAELHERRPDYVFARTALAQFALEDGKVERASELIKPLLQAKRLHGSEARSIFSTQAMIAMKRRDIEGAEKAISVLAQILGEDDSNVTELRIRMGALSCRNWLRHAFVKRK